MILNSNSLAFKRHSVCLSVWWQAAVKRSSVSQLELLISPSSATLSCQITFSNELISSFVLFNCTNAICGYCFVFILLFVEIYVITIYHSPLICCLLEILLIIVSVWLQQSLSLALFLSFISKNRCLSIWHTVYPGGHSTQNAGRVTHTHTLSHYPESCISTSLARNSWQQSRSKTLWCRINPCCPLKIQTVILILSEMPLQNTPEILFLSLIE